MSHFWGLAGSSPTAKQSSVHEVPPAWPWAPGSCWHSSCGPTQHSAVQKNIPVSSLLHSSKATGWQRTLSLPEGILCLTRGYRIVGTHKEEQATRPYFFLVLSFQKRLLYLKKWCIRESTIALSANYVAVCTAACFPTAVWWAGTREARLIFKSPLNWDAKSCIKICRNPSRGSYA